MLINNLENVLQVALEDLIHGSHDILMEAMGIWKNNMKFRYFFFHPKRYLSNLRGVEINEYPWVAFEIMVYVIWTLTYMVDACIMFVY